MKKIMTVDLDTISLFFSPLRWKKKLYIFASYSDIIDFFFLLFLPIVFQVYLGYFRLLLSILFFFPILLFEVKDASSYVKDIDMISKEHGGKEYYYVSIIFSLSKIK